MSNITTFFLQAILLYILITSTMPVLSAGEPSSAGTGFVVNPDGYLLTCEHVVRDADKIKVTLGDKTWEAAVISVDKVHDLALIQIPAKGLPVLPLVNSDGVEVGQEVRAFGYPLSDLLGDNIKVTRGTISGISKFDTQKVFQFDAAANPGNSGGPLVNEKGEVLGIINAKIKDSVASAVAFAVPVNYAINFMQINNIKSYIYPDGIVKVDGPSLVKRVSPSVALITVWDKPDEVIYIPKSTPTPAVVNKSTKVNPKDNAEIVLIPAGEFLMGSMDSDKLASNDEKPIHKVYLNKYYIYKTEVTVLQYYNFCSATGRKMPPAPDWGWQDNHPIVNVTWYDAKAYAEWAGAILPSEAQWEKAARGSDGRIYPWGNKWEGSKCANWDNSGEGNTPKGTHIVGSFPSGASLYGVLDMSGNAYEWCDDFYNTDYYKNNKQEKNPMGPDKGDTRVLRGGSWVNIINDGNNYRCAYRYDFNSSNYGVNIGFRCAMLIDKNNDINNIQPDISPPIQVPSPKSLYSDFPKHKINPKDGAEMILIPSGEFLMENKNVQDEKSQQKVYLDVYYIYKTEVTVAQYRKFCKMTKRKMPEEPAWKWQDNHPIINVNWNDAKAYADWVGATLPTEAQWEKAARGTDGRIYPWGNKWDETKCANNYRISDKGDLLIETHSVGSFPTGASPYGVMDMTGNVFEWCADWYDSNYKIIAAKNPTGPKTGEFRILRGGSWGNNIGYHYYYNSCAFRNGDYPYDCIGFFGFRCTLKEE